MGTAIAETQINLSGNLILDNSEIQNDKVQIIKEENII